VNAVTELIAAIEADPADAAPQLVIADLLQSEGDPRGELIVLDHAERAGALRDPDALERLLLLAAELSFPRATPDDPVLPFVRVDPNTTHFRVWHDGVRYELRYRPYQLAVMALDQRTGDYRDYRSMLQLESCTEGETAVLLAIFSDAIRAQTPLDELRFPYGTLPPPVYEGGPLRCYRLPLDFTVPRGILRNRYGLAARDYHRWNAIWQRLRAMP
jgi:uncharacterized protein (TIGR02996 family)